MPEMPSFTGRLLSSITVEEKAAVFCAGYSIVGDSLGTVMRPDGSYDLGQVRVGRLVKTERDNGGRIQDAIPPYNHD